MADSPSIPSWLVALVRSSVQLVVGKLFSSAVVLAIVEWITEMTGAPVTQAAVENFAFLIAFGAVVTVVNWLGKQPRWVWINSVFSLFLAKSAAAYEGTKELPKAA